MQALLPTWTDTGPGISDISRAAADAIAGAGGVIYLHAYAVSYGVDRGHRRYSTPLRIGRVELELPFQ